MNQYAEKKLSPARCADFAELKAIQDALRRDHSDDEYILERVNDLTREEVMVREDYISDGPGFAGKLAVIFWGEPQFVTVLGDNGWTDTNWEVIKLEVLYE